MYHFASILYTYVLIYRRVFISTKFKFNYKVILFNTGPLGAMPCIRMPCMKILNISWEISKIRWICASKYFKIHTSRFYQWKILSLCKHAIFTRKMYFSRWRIDQTEETEFVTSHWCFFFQFLNYLSDICLLFFIIVANQAYRACIFVRYYEHCCMYSQQSAQLGYIWVMDYSDTILE